MILGVFVSFALLSRGVLCLRVWEMEINKKRAAAQKKEAYGSDDTAPPAAFVPVESSRNDSGRFKNASENLKMQVDSIYKHFWADKIPL